jgi:hypothetical protein
MTIEKSVQTRMNRRMARLYDDLALHENRDHILLHEELAKELKTGFIDDVGVVFLQCMTEHWTLTESEILARIAPQSAEALEISDAAESTSDDTDIPEIRPCDPTEFECSVNHIHVGDYVRETASITDLLWQGFLYAKQLTEDLGCIFPEKQFAVILAFDEFSEFPDCTVRFHQIREENSWLTDDLELYKDEAILVWEIV